MNVLVAGHGSIGSRRAGILRDMGHDVTTVDPDPASGADRSDLPPDMGGLDAVLVCTPPETHLAVAREALEHDIRGLYVEKPLALTDEGWDEVVEECERRGIVTMGACNLRFDGRLGVLVGYLGDEIAGAETVEFMMRQHWKHWSPQHEPVSIILDSIHELDLAVHLRGPIVRILGHSSKDQAFVVATHDSGRVSVLTLDRMTDPPDRCIWIGAAYHSESYRVGLWPPDEGMYEREMRHFMRCVERGNPTCNPLASALSTLRHALPLVSDGEVAVTSTGATWVPA